MSRSVTASEALQRAEDLAQSYYALGAQSGIHSMIEWCGVMGEYVKMLREAHKAGIDPREVDQHHTECKVVVPEFMAEYFAEKLGCQLKPFIRADHILWRRLLETWFEGAQQCVVCDLIRQRPAVSTQPSEAAALDYAVELACENLYAREGIDAADTPADVKADFRETLLAHDCIREGDYEVYILNASPV